MLSVYSPKPTESTAIARRAKEVDFTARNFATIAPAAQGPLQSTGQLAENSRQFTPLRTAFVLSPALRVAKR